MITINDLNISRECWEWLIKLTTRWHLICNQILSISIDGKADLYKSESCLLRDINDEWSFHILESIIYQAKDGLNDLFLLHKKENNFYEIMESSGVLIIQKSMIYSCPIPEHHIIYDEYENKTTARLAALKWIWEQVNKEE